MVNWKDFEVGKRVVCIIDQNKYIVSVPNAILPKKGHIYTIRSQLAKGRELGVHLVEIVHPPAQWLDGFYEPYFIDARYFFRPIDETRIDQFRAMLHNLPKLPVLSY